MTARRRIRVRGAVQGVGFRPFVYLLAVDLGLGGWVLNNADGVLIEVEARAEALDEFGRRLVGQAPAHARIDGVDTTGIEPRGEASFEIRPSPPGPAGATGILPDLATCPACLAEVLDPADRRFRYPFTNCTHCGPRFSILERLPYDRVHTTMAAFTMCPACQAEYDDPADRRFHAQPNACPTCGPQLRLGDLPADDALRCAGAMLRDGGIVAMKGIGGFHLLANALDAEAVSRLRSRKARGRKPFAVMFADVAVLQQYCAPTTVELEAMCSAASPIVLVRALPRALPEQVAPGNPLVGAMLPYSPLHHVLARDVGFPLVATSANAAGEPICVDIESARALLGDVADAFLDHDRPIRRPVEDSVVRQYEDDVVVLRRGRGLAPAPVSSCTHPGVLGRGAQLKSALAVSHADAIIAGPHIGDLSDDLRSIETYERAVADFEALFSPGISAVDAHPDYVSRCNAVDAIEVQHHHAHAAACLAEHDVETALAVVWDGTGYGGDGTIWGGEFLVATRASFERFAHLRQFRLPGGEAAIREPARQALAMLWELGLDLGDHPERDALVRMLESGLNSPVTSAAGRLFDVVSSLLGLAPPHVSFDGEAAVNLEHVAADHLGIELPTPALSGAIVDWGPLIRALVSSDASPTARAAGFHDAMARAIAAVAAEVDLEHVALVGGCFQNRRLLESAAASLRTIGRTPIWCRQIPPNDGGIAVGQVAVVAARLSRK